MSSMPSFLPSVLNLDSDVEVAIAQCYKVFQQDFVKSGPLHNSSSVELDLRLSSEQKENTFWHLIMFDQKWGRDGLYDRQRAMRISWVRPLIECGPTEGLIKFNHQHNHNTVRRYLWLPASDYCVILQPMQTQARGRIFRFISAHYLDFDTQREKMKQKYVDRIV